jgi:Flp pilus assembly pilin Flp
MFAGRSSQERGESCLLLFQLADKEKIDMMGLAKRLWRNEEGQDIAEYAVMLAVILVIVIGTIRLIGGNANNVFSSVANSIQ